MKPYDYTVTMYMCAVDFRHELGEASDLEGCAPLYSTVEELKARRPCWNQCGIVEVQVKMTKWVVEEDFSSLERGE